MMAHALTNKERAAIIAGLQAGASQLRVSADTGIPVCVVSRIAREAGVGSRERRGMSPEKRQHVAKLVRDGFCNADVVRLARVSATSARTIRKEVEAAK